MFFCYSWNTQTFVSRFIFKLLKNVNTNTPNFNVAINLSSAVNYLRGGLKTGQPKVSRAEAAGVFLSPQGRWRDALWEATDHGVQDPTRSWSRSRGVENFLGPNPAALHPLRPAGATSADFGRQRRRKNITAWLALQFTPHPQKINK